MNHDYDHGGGHSDLDSAPRSGPSLLAIKSDVRGKAAIRDDGKAGMSVLERSRSSSLASSIATTADEQANTQLSASSAGATLSSEASANSTARTSAMTDDDRPTATTTPSTHAHPAVTVLELTSNTASSSALPDSFGFNVSRQGNFVAVYTASSIWLIRTAQLPRLWARTLQVKRKPVAVDILEDGSLLAVLSRPSQVDVYEIQGEPHMQIKKRRTVMLVHEAQSMALSPDGLILITGNKFGIEVVSVGPNAPESSRRTLSGPVGDCLQFSDDGRTLLITGYARNTGSSSMFVLPGLYDGPLNEEGVPIPAAPEAAWTGLVLFPETTKIARQATLLPDAVTGHIDELFAFNSDEDTWGIYDIPSQRFTKRNMFLPDQQRWTRAEFLDDAMPAVSPNADLAAVALRMRGTTTIWLYQVPEWDYKPSQGMEHAPIQPCFCIPILHERADINQEISSLRWVKIDSNIQRLVAVGNISTISPDSGRPSAPEGSKGVIIVLDFDKTKAAGGPAPAPMRTEFDLDPLLPGEKLPEGSIDFEREVELVRTRTLAQRRAQEGAERRNSRSGSGPGRAHTTANRQRRTSVQPSVPTITRDDSEELTMEEAQAAFEAPYDNTQPRSQSSLARAATVAAVSPANRRHLRALPFRPLEYRRADGLREFPHESDADNWVPPPPAYTEKAEASHSVSLSHPGGAPPVPALPNSLAGSSIPPVPPLPATVNPSQLVTNPYQSRSGSFQSVSSTDLTLPALRRPSLLHPSTFPSPQPPTSGRRRSSASSTQQGYQNHTSMQQHQQQQRLQQEQSAYQASSAGYQATRRPTRGSGRRVESTIDLRPPPVVDPNSMRRGSAPDTVVHRRPVPGAAPTANMVNARHQHHGSVPQQHQPYANTPQQQNYASTPQSQQQQPQGNSSGNAPGRPHSRRSILPRLSIHSVQSQTHESRNGPLSAPPRTTAHTTRRPDMQARAQSQMSMREHMGMRGQGQPTQARSEMGMSVGGREKKKRVGCVVM